MGAGSPCIGERINTFTDLQVVIFVRRSRNASTSNQNFSNKSENPPINDSQQVSMNKTTAQ